MFCFLHLRVSFKMFCLQIPPSHLSYRDQPLNTCCADIQIRFVSFKFFPHTHTHTEIWMVPTIKAWSNRQSDIYLKAAFFSSFPIFINDDSDQIELFLLFHLEGVLLFGCATSAADPWMCEYFNEFLLFRLDRDSVWRLHA